MDEGTLAGRQFGEVYRVKGRQDLHRFLLASVEASGGRVLYASDPGRAPVYLGVQLDSDERVGMLIYPFRVGKRETLGRPDDEIRGQLRYGAEASWERDHPVGRDIAGVDVTMILGIDVENEVYLGLDANLWDPLPMGISFYAKDYDFHQAKQTRWHVWEKTNNPGTKRKEARSPTQLETVVAFTPDRLINYARLERRATSLRLDPPLRYAAATAMLNYDSASEVPQKHVLESQFELTSQEILDIINGRNRLAVAVRGGVAEHHLEKQLRSNPAVSNVVRLDADAMHDFDVTLKTGKTLRVECKNASPKKDKDGHYKVEVQKTRASKNDPASRFYSVDSFDVVAACLYSALRKWEFRFGRTIEMTRHKDFEDRLKPVQVITDEWVEEVASLTELASACRRS